jgi:RecA/RadA recombinase
MKRGRPKKHLVTDAVATENCKATVSVEQEVKENPKLDRLRKLINETNRDAKRVVIKFANEEAEVERIPFGIKEIDELTGGLACKRFNIVWGGKGVGKTTLSYYAMREAQKLGKVCAFIDAERTFDAQRAKECGVNVEEVVLINEFDCAEQFMDTLIAMLNEKAVDFIIIDSIQAFSPKAEQESKKGKIKSVEDDSLALLARKLSQFFRMCANKVYQANACILLIGQTRTALGGYVTFDQLSGGNALGHWSSLTLAMRRGAKADAPTKKVVSKDADGIKTTETKVIGFMCNFKLEKRKVSSQVEGSEVNVPFLFEEGFKSHD